MGYMVMTLCKELQLFFSNDYEGFTLLKSDACDGVMRPFFKSDG